MAKKRSPPTKVWFHHHQGDVWWCDTFRSKRAAKKALHTSKTHDKRGREVTLKKAGWGIVGPYVLRRKP